MEIEVLRNITLTSAWASVIISFICILLHYLFPKLRKNPGQLILLHIFFQLYLEINFLIAFGFPDAYNYLINYCEVVGSLLIFSVYLQLNCILLSTIEIFCLIQHSIVTAHTKRQHLLQLLSVSIALGSAGVSLLTDSIGVDEYKLCIIKDFSFGEFYTFAYVFIIAVAGWTISAYSLSRTSKKFSWAIKQYFKLLTFGLGYLTILIALCAVYLVYRKELLKHLTLSYFFISGCTLGLMRILNKTMINEIYWKLCKKRKREKFRYSGEGIVRCNSLLLELSEDSFNLNEFFEHKAFLILIKVLSSISFLVECKSKNCEVFNNFSVVYFHEKEFSHHLIEHSCGFPLNFIRSIYDPDMEIINYYPEIFECIRELCHLSYEDYCNSFFNIENIEKFKKLQSLEGGRSNSLLFTTFDEKFTIKIIRSVEKENMIKLVPSYFNRISSRSSRLVKIYAFMTILPEKIDVLLMENLLPNRNSKVIFDMKGSTHNRKVEISSFPVPNKVLKDLNFFDSQVKILLNKSNEHVIYELKKDFDVLYKVGLIDYSILIAIDINSISPKNEVLFGSGVSIGIIDFLQNYNFVKKTEKTFKAIINPCEDCSSTNPKEYFLRITELLSKIFKIEDANSEI